MQIKSEPGAKSAALTPPGTVESGHVLLMGNVKERDLMENTVSPNNHMTVTTGLAATVAARSMLVWGKNVRHKWTRFSTSSLYSLAITVFYLRSLMLSFENVRAHNV